MRCLITGGAGFVGSHLAEELLARGHRVHVLDDLSTGDIRNISHLKPRPDFGWTIDSASNAPLVAELVDEAEVVYHLAAAVGVRLVADSPARTLETNVRCTEIVLAHASTKHKPVFLASTSEVYGKNESLPLREDSDLLLGSPSKSRGAYAYSKALGECLAFAYWKERRLPIVIGRLFNTVGPRQTGRYGMVVPTFVRQALSEQPIVVYGDGSQRRCFCHVDDVVRAAVDLMERDDTHGEVFNIGSNEETTILELAQRVRHALGSRSEIVLVPYEEAFDDGFEDIDRRVPDTRKLQRLIGWRPTRGLAEAVVEVAEHERTRAGTEREVLHVP